jgi:hypothetical protein
LIVPDDDGRTRSGPGVTDEAVAFETAHKEEAPISLVRP